MGPVDGRLLLEEAERVDRVVGSLRWMILFLTRSVLSFLTILHLFDLYMLMKVKVAAEKPCDLEMMIIYKKGVGR